MFYNIIKFYNKMTIFINLGLLDKYFGKLRSVFKIFVKFYKIFLEFCKLFLQPDVFHIIHVLVNFPLDKYWVHGKKCSLIVIYRAYHLSRSQFRCVNGKFMGL